MKTKTKKKMIITQLTMIILNQIEKKVHMIELIQIKKKKIIMTELILNKRKVQVNMEENKIGTDDLSYYALIFIFHPIFKLNKESDKYITHKENVQILKFSFLFTQ